MIDDHCHPFSLTPGTFDPAGFSLDVEPGPEADIRRRVLAPGRVSQELLTSRLAARLGCAHADVPAARAQAAADWPGYVAGLFAEAGITGLVMDTAYPPGSEERLGEFADLAGCPAWWIQRIDYLVDRMIGQGAGAREIVEAVLLTMSDAAKDGCVGYKTVIAYRTGLGVDPRATVADAERSLGEDLPVRRRAKALRDHVLTRALGLAADLGKPFQIHTGLGDSELRLAESNPLLLDDLLRSPEGSGATVVLIHGSFPWHEQAAYLAATRPNLWTELSLFNIYSPATVADRLLRTLDLAPAGRVLMGTDGHGEPETFWFAASVLREAWADVRARLRGAGARDAWLDTTGSMIFEDNARSLYGL